MVADYNVLAASRYGADDPSDPHLPETYALLTRSAPSAPGTAHGPASDAGSGTHYSGYPASTAPPTSLGPGSPSNEFSLERHEDAGPVPFLQRSASGRLPPAYRSWEQAQEPEEPMPGSELGSSNGASSVGGAQTSESGAALQPLRPQYLGDVKTPRALS